MSRRGSTAFVPKPFVRSFSSVHCIKCRKQFPTRWFRDALLSDELDVLRCSQLQTRFANAQTIDNKPEHFDKTSSSASFSHQSQTTGEEEALHKHTDVVKTEPWWKSKDWTASTCDGLVKPDVTFFGEKLPRRFWEMAPRDLAEADLLIVLGTSLQVYPFAEMVNMVSPYCPRLLINREATGMESNYRAGFQFFKEDNYRDVLLLGECQSGIRQLCVLLQWEPELQKLREQYKACPKEDHWTVLEKLQVEDPPHSADELNLYESAFHELDNDSSE